MRKVFKKVKLGKDYGLSSSDIRLIRRSDPGDIGLLAMQGHYNSIDTLLDEGSSNAM